MTDAVGMGALNEDVIYTIKIGMEAELLKAIKKESRLHVETHENYSGLINKVLRVPGGSAANTITDLASSGWKCSFIGELGNDDRGRFVERSIKSKNIELIATKTDGPTGSCGIIMHEDGKYSVLFKEGVSDDIRINEDASKAVKSCKLFHSSPFSSFKSLESLKTQVLLARAAKKSGATVSTSPGRLYAETFTGGDKTGKMILIEKLLRHSDIIFINENESRMISGESDHSKASKLMIKNYGQKTICITLGSMGCHVRDSHEHFNIGTDSSAPVTTLGAGDAFAAGFLDAHLRGYDTEKCAERGNEFASLRVKFVDPKHYREFIKLKQGA